MSSLYKDVEFMLKRSGESSLKVDSVLRSVAKNIKKSGETAVYQSFNAQIRFNLCCSRILQGNFSDWDGWMYRDEWAVLMKNSISTVPFWDGRNVDRLVIIAEQGVGDEILFSSVLPEAMVRCKEVTYCCDERLIETFQRSFPGLVVRKRYVDAREDLIGGYDAFIPSADLLALFRKSKAHFPKKPFIKPNPDRVAEFEQYRGRVGISWRGRHGSIKPLSLGIDNPLSLQYNEQHPEIEVPNIDLKNDLEGVIALCSVLDKVVCVPTSVWHFAAAIGTKTEVILADAGTEFLEDGVVDQLDWHCPLGDSPYYDLSKVYKNVKEWKKNV